MVSQRILKILVFLESRESAASNNMYFYFRNISSWCFYLAIGQSCQGGGYTPWQRCNSPWHSPLKGEIRLGGNLVFLFWKKNTDCYFELGELQHYVAVQNRSLACERVSGSILYLSYSAQNHIGAIPPHCSRLTPLHGTSPYPTNVAKSWNVLPPNLISPFKMFRCSVRSISVCFCF